MLTKEKLIQTIETLPDNFTTEDVIDRIILLSKIDIGSAQIDNGQTYTTEEAREHLQKWLK